MQASTRPAASRQFIPIRVAALRAFRDFRPPIFLRSPETHRYCLYCDRSGRLAANDLNRLEDAGISIVYIGATEHERFLEEARESVRTVLRDETIPVAERLSALNEVVRDVLRDAFRWGKVSDAVAQTAELAGHLVDLLCRDDFLAAELQSVLHFDSTTFTHSSNVAAYSVLLAHSLSQTDHRLLAKIARGALLHDIGKLEVPQHILVKRGPLTAAERDEMNRHPAFGLARMGHEEQLDYGQLMMIYQHHERIDGTGYPVRLEAESIHDWARICSVADVYEALTSHRPYRRPFSTAVALEHMQDGRRLGLDPEFFRCWKMTISKN